MQVLLFVSFYLSFKTLVILTPQAGVIDKLNRLGRTLSVDMDMLKIFAIKLPVWEDQMRNVWTIWSQLVDIVHQAYDVAVSVLDVIMRLIVLNSIVIFRAVWIHWDQKRHCCNHYGISISISIKKNKVVSLIWLKNNSNRIKETKNNNRKYNSKSNKYYQIDIQSNRSPTLDQNIIL